MPCDSTLPCWCVAVQLSALCCDDDTLPEGPITGTLRLNGATSVTDPTSGASIVGLPIIQRFTGDDVEDCDGCPTISTCELPPNIDSGGAIGSLEPVGTTYQLALNVAGTPVVAEFQIDAAIDYTAELVCGCIPVTILSVTDAPANSDVFCIRVASCLTITSPDASITVTNPSPGVWEIVSPRSAVTDNGDGTYTHDDGAGNETTWQAGVTLNDCDGVALAAGDTVSRCPVHPDGTPVATNGAGRPVIVGVVDGSGNAVAVDGDGNHIVCSCPVTEDPDNPGTYLDLPVSPGGAPIVPGVVDGSGALVSQDGAGNWQVCSCPVIEDPDNPGAFLPLPVDPDGAPIIPPGTPLLDCDGVALTANDTVSRCPVHPDGAPVPTNGAGQPIIPRDPVIEDPNNPGTFLPLPAAPSGAAIIPPGGGAALLDCDGVALADNDTVTRCPVFEDPNNPGTFLVGVTDGAGAAVLPTFTDNADGTGTIVDPNGDTCPVPLQTLARCDGTDFAKGEVVTIPECGLVGRTQFAAGDFFLAGQPADTVLPVMAPQVIPIENTTTCPMQLMVWDTLHVAGFDTGGLRPIIYTDLSFDNGGTWVGGSHSQQATSFVPGNYHEQDVLTAVPRVTVIAPGATLNLQVRTNALYENDGTGVPVANVDGWVTIIPFVGWVGIPSC